MKLTQHGGCIVAVPKQSDVGVDVGVRCFQVGGTIKRKRKGPKVLQNIRNDFKVYRALNGDECGDLELIHSANFQDTSHIFDYPKCQRSLP